MVKNKRRRYSLLLVLLFIPLFLTGCFDYHDINKVTFPTSIIFDIDDLGEAIVYLDCIKPYRSTNDSSDKGRRIIYKGQGKTALEALSDINRVSSFKLDYTQTRAYIFTEKASRKGIKKFLDLINNNSEFSMKPSAFVYYGDVDELLKTVSTDEEYLGLFLNDLVGKEKYNPKAVKSNINYYLSNILMGSNTALLTSIALKDNAIDKKIEIQGSSIFKDNILVEKIDVVNSLMYNIMMGNAKSGTLEVANPQDKQNFITLQILDSSVVDKLQFQDGKYKLIKNVNVDVSVSEIQGKLIVDSSSIDYIEVNEEAYINGYVEYLFNKYKEEGLDIFDVERLVEMYYPHENIDNPLSVTELEVNTKINIKGTGVVKDSL
ncbi:MULTISPECIES: Ger(x)C family spore germination protein [unclassified Clostridium]|uniref:Ger(x)C family spore germination protein n=1 Tax=Clostridium TaxID=1485 RepID=UPI001C8BA136|nr:MULTISPECIES: Ger(x)C family spore germination protein [unclassified Clostridium]MBX9138893.1 Ger(x)C family spore germination protein [Clostridium sp. K12(2020)]MBX9145684.1 Ger(x)C family spore germination protein [Clostridium sp. K13]MDU2291330.1 Ger(x)C family spore germination protein [Clostridium celatum]MDU4324516.1 Ger(x)C family spore germination protein [Clostridium celatum]